MPSSPHLPPNDCRLRQIVYRLKLSLQIVCKGFGFLRICEVSFPVLPVLLKEGNSHHPSSRIPQRRVLRIKFGLLAHLHLNLNHFEDDVLALFKHVPTYSCLCFEGHIYEQTEGVAMTLPLSPVIANTCMEDFEKKY